MTISEKLLAVTRQLLPTGRAFRIGYGSTNEAVEKALIESEKRTIEDGMSILDTILPDNDNFSTEDATRWEQRLGLITNDLVSLTDRKLAIKRKMNHPGDVLARQSADYIQSQLQLAGFDVFIYENPTGLTPEDILTQHVLSNYGQLGDSNQLDDYQLGDVYTFWNQYFSSVIQLNDYQLGDFQLAEYLYLNKCVNFIEQSFDSTFNIADYTCSFIVAGTLDANFIAQIPAARKDEFRQLILKLKPTQNPALLFIDYI